MMSVKSDWILVSRFLFLALRSLCRGVSRDGWRAPARAANNRGWSWRPAGQTRNRTLEDKAARSP